MPRIGFNPARGRETDYFPGRITVAVLTHIPHLSGYYRHRFDVLKAVLAAHLAFNGSEYELMVLNNGSCDPVREYLDDLHAGGQIQYLIHTPANIGILGAFRTLFGAAPGEIIAYADDDVLVYPGWLDAQAKILETFDQVGLVSGAPVRDGARHARASMDRFAAEPGPGVNISFQRVVRDEWEADWAQSTGRDPQQHLQNTREIQDMVIEKAGVTAIAGASHFQFMTYKKTILQAIPPAWSGKLMDDLVRLDQAIDALGLLRLSTPMRYVRHLGNALSDELIHELKEAGVQVEDLKTAKQAQKKHRWLLRIPGAGRTMWWLYNKLFDILHD